MRLSNIIAVATAVEAALLGGLMSLVGVGGVWSPWLDVVNQFAPIWLAIAVLGGVATWALLDRGVERTVVVALAVAGVIGAGSRVAPELARAVGDLGQGAAAGRSALTVLTFNVWDENHNPDAAFRTIEAAGPDVVDLQEYGGAFRIEDKALQALYPHQVTCPRGFLSDVELYSRLPVIAQGCLILDPDHRLANPLHFVWARVRAPDGRPATIVTTHLVWPLPPGPQERELIALAEQLRRFPTDELILTGDFNLTPWSSAMQRSDRRLLPLRRRSHALFSWPTVFLKPGLPAPFPILPIDQVFAGPGWKTVLVKRLQRSSSDHYPVLVTLYR